MTTAPSMDGLQLAGRPFVPGQGRVAVLGGGVMGPGIALTFAERGFAVDLCDVRADLVERGLQSLRDALALKCEAGLSDPAQSAAVIDRVQGKVGVASALPQARLVIEAVSEDRAIKTDVYAQVVALAAPDTVVWSNTSTMDVFALAPAALLPRLAVAHWFAPPHILPLVEVVGGEATDPATLDDCERVLKALGKTPVRLNKFVPGFVINRLQRALGHEAFHLIASGVISAENLDLAVRTSLAPRMQLLGLMQRYDFTGLNLSLRNLADRAIVDAPQDLEPAPLTERVARGELGVSTGKGFYDYAGRSVLDLQRERDAGLWQVVQGLGDLLSDPKPL